MRFIAGCVCPCTYRPAVAAALRDERRARYETTVELIRNFNVAQTVSYQNAEDCAFESATDYRRGMSYASELYRALIERENAPLQSPWQNIATAPKDGTYILVAGDSGYTTTPLRVEVCRYDPEYRPLSPWVNHANDCFEDGGEPPTHWMPLPSPPRSDGKNDDLYCWRCERLITNRTTITCPHCCAEIDEAGKCPPV